MRRPVILLDIDGVCADFVTPVVQMVSHYTGRTLTPDDLTEWDIMRSLGVSQSISDRIDEHIRTEGFCRSLELYAGAVEGVNELRQFADVYPVTAPFAGPNWIHEREQWLVEKLGFNRHDIVYTAAKHLVVGDVLVDDKTETLHKWHGQPHTGRAVQFARPWNRHDNWDRHVAQDWPHLVRILRLLYDDACPY